MWLVGGLVGIYMWHGWYLEFRGPSVGMQDKTGALSRLCALPLIDALLWGFSVLNVQEWMDIHSSLYTNADCVLFVCTALRFLSV